MKDTYGYHRLERLIWKISRICQNASIEEIEALDLSSNRDFYISEICQHNTLEVLKFTIAKYKDSFHDYPLLCRAVCASNSIEKIEYVHSLCKDIQFSEEEVVDFINNAFLACGRKECELVINLFNPEKRERVYGILSSINDKIKDAEWKRNKIMEISVKPVVCECCGIEHLMREFSFEAIYFITDKVREGKVVVVETERFPSLSGEMILIPELIAFCKKMDLICGRGGDITKDVMRLIAHSELPIECPGSAIKKLAESSDVQSLRYVVDKVKDGSLKVYESEINKIKGNFSDMIEACLEDLRSLSSKKEKGSW